MYIYYTYVIYTYTYIEKIDWHTTGIEPTCPYSLNY